MVPVELTFRADGRPRLIYIGTDLHPYELDEGEYPADPREAAICAALRKVSKPVRGISRISGT
jgi:hypothetical protein